VVDNSITYKEKKLFLLKNKLALWDVIESCERDGSSDNKIKNEVINNFEALFNTHDFKKVIFNGKKAAKLFKQKYKGLLTRAEFITLNSSSNQNPNNTFRVLAEWNKYLK
jgi:hypoxanthine-DNA glycosylase